MSGLIRNGSNGTACGNLFSIVGIVVLMDTLLWQDGDDNGDSEEMTCVEVTEPFATSSSLSSLAHLSSTGGMGVGEADVADTVCASSSSLGLLAHDGVGAKDMMAETSPQQVSVASKAIFGGVDGSEGSCVEPHDVVLDVSSDGTSLDVKEAYNDCRSLLKSRFTPPKGVEDGDGGVSSFPFR